MYQPTLEEVRRLAGSGNMVPVHREITADLDTPVSAYLKVARPPYSFLLESVEGGDRIARYSFIGAEPYDVIRTGPGEKHGSTDPLAHVEAALKDRVPVGMPDDQRFNGGAVGFLAYEAVNYFERLPSPDSDPLDLPEVGLHDDGHLHHLRPSDAQDADRQPRPSRPGRGPRLRGGRAPD